MPLQPGTRFLGYDILSALGAGGMGEVFLAYDSRLQRKIAIKVLPEAFASDASRIARFEREARAISSLNHPHIVTLFDIGQVGRTWFMATEYVEGRSLRAELRARGRLPVAEALGIVRQCATALAAAHDAGIVHRDIKPENIMLRADGYVKVLDFGLASVRATAGPEDRTLTRVDAGSGPGVILGTTGYLSPEQARGLPTDGRSDIFALGVVLFEIVSGTAPFRGETPSDMIASILRSDPPALSKFAPGVPAHLECLVSRMLSKTPEQRPDSMRSVAADLARQTVVSQPAPKTARLLSRTRLAIVALATLTLTAAAFMLPGMFYGGSIGVTRPVGSTPIHSLAVMPFKLLGFEPGEEHLGLGMADALIVKLTSLRELTVRPTTAVESYQRKTVDLPDAARALKVDAILTGNVQRAAGRLRVTVQLVRIADGGVRAIWSDEFRSDTNDPFDVQERLATQLLENLPVQLTGEERTQYVTEASANARALRLYTEGRYFFHKGSTETIERALALFVQAAVVDPKYARAYLGQARALNSLIETGAAPRDTTLPKAWLAIARAIELDPALGEAYGLRSLMHRVFGWQFGAAEADSQRSLDLAPNNPEVLQWRGVHLLASGRGDEAVELQKRAVEIDPLDLALRGHLCRGQFLTKRYDDAVATGNALIEMAESSSAYQWVGLSYVALDRLDEGIRALERALALEPKNFERIGSLGYAYARAGRINDANRLLGRLSADDLAYHRAIVLLGLGKNQLAVTQLEHAWNNREGFLANRGRLDPRLDPVRSDPRVRRMFDQLR